MTWLNPAAFIGLLALSVPIFVHLFGRRIARRQLFPSLRLLLDSRPTPVTRSRPSDLLLLFIRCAVILAAVLAVAQPRWSSPERDRDASVPTRLILVDTSASMRRLTSDGSVLRDLAVRAAQRMLDSARDGMVVETAYPGADIAGASSWLSRRSGLRELVILSDFQLNALSDGNLAAVPQGVGVTLRRVGTSSSPMEPDSTSVVSVRVDDDVTVASWRSLPVETPLPVSVHTTGADSVAASAMIGAVRGEVHGRAPAGREVTIEFVDPFSLPASSRLDQPWHGDLLLTLRRSRLLGDAVAASGRALACEPPSATISTTPTGVMLHSCLEAGSVAATALSQATTAALLRRPDFKEQEPSFVSDDMLRSWERPATEMAPRGQDETSPHGRWFWLLAIGLLALEHFVRRERGVRAVPSTAALREERVA